MRIGNLTIFMLSGALLASASAVRAQPLPMRGHQHQGAAPWQTPYPCNQLNDQVDDQLANHAAPQFDVDDVDLSIDQTFDTRQVPPNQDDDQPQPPQGGRGLRRGPGPGAPGTPGAPDSIGGNRGRRGFRGGRGTSPHPPSQPPAPPLPQQMIPQMSDQVGQGEPRTRHPMRPQMQGGPGPQQEWQPRDQQDGPPPRFGPGMRGMQHRQPQMGPQGSGPGAGGPPTQMQFKHMRKMMRMHRMMLRMQRMEQMQGMPPMQHLQQPGRMQEFRQGPAMRGQMGMMQPPRGSGQFGPHPNQGPGMQQIPRGQFGPGPGPRMPRPGMERQGMPGPYMRGPQMRGPQMRGPGMDRPGPAMRGQRFGRGEQHGLSNGIPPEMIDQQLPPPPPPPPMPFGDQPDGFGGPPQFQPQGMFDPDFNAPPLDDQGPFDGQSMEWPNDEMQSFPPPPLPPPSGPQDQETGPEQPE